MKWRWITENSIIAQELIHKIKKHKGLNGLMLLKIDLKKAYDWMEWSFVSKVLEAMGSQDFISLIISCLSSANFQLLLNECKFKAFNPIRGLR